MDDTPPWGVLPMAPGRHDWGSIPAPGQAARSRRPGPVRIRTRRTKICNQGDISMTSPGGFDIESLKKNALIATIVGFVCGGAIPGVLGRSEEHTSELQSRGHLVCRLLLEKKKKQTAVR